jgi:hypothetical protein
MSIDGGGYKVIRVPPGPDSLRSRESQPFFFFDLLLQYQKKKNRLNI